MSETLEANTSAPITQEQEIEEIIKGLEQYRERLINQTLEHAKKAKVSKAQTMAALEQHPELSKIDQALKDLRSPTQNQTQQPTP
ncbi:MAG: acetyltransferase [Okeania sp. SIO3I5]|uniref:acetyltransferase n=1 Tax=Okeania sp. SIO3I5 TaxID=2607805 RepID=UPI0013BE33FE|nr:acetyltransferase [Okeania sp. SIO3I5]NEQ35317.1 acetyltransferase [Okeania sp. SIO3I5]